MPEHKYESYTQSVGVAIFLGVATLMLTGAALAVVAWLNSGWTAASIARQPAVTPVAQEALPPPAPRLQISPGADMAQLKRSEDNVLETYGWVDADQGIVRVPIERAMALVAEEAQP